MAPEYDGVRVTALDGRSATRGIASVLEIDPERDDLRVGMARMVAEEKLEGEAFETSLRQIGALLDRDSLDRAAKALDAFKENFKDNPGLLELEARLEERRGNREHRHSEEHVSFMLHRESH